jgi:hypothetical protein
LGALGVGGITILKWIICKYTVRVRIGLTIAFVNSNELLGS